MKIESGVLVYYTARKKVAVLPEDVEMIGDWAFSDTGDMGKMPSERIRRTSIEEIILPPSLRVIGKGAFDRQIDLRKVDFCEGLSEVGELAFSYCSSLTEIILPSTIQAISTGAFSNCTALTKVVIPQPVKGCTDGKNSECCISESLFSYCSALKEIIIPAGTKTIGNIAFIGCKSLMAIDIPDSVEEIGTSAFCECSSLTDIILPESIRMVASGAFRICEALKKVVIPHAIGGTVAGESIPNCISDGLFSRCCALKEVHIPIGTKIIGKEAFWSCQALEEISIPDSVEEIGDQAFGYCIGLRVIRLPSSVMKIGKEAFPHGEHSKLEQILVDPENEAYCSVDGVLYSKDSKTLIQCPANYPNTIYKVPEGVEEISSSAFEGCQNIRKVVLPDSVIQIGENAFSRMYSLKTVVLPTSLKVIGKEVFAYCVKLNDVQWPKVPFTIGEGCFCQTGFDKIALPDTVISVGNYAFASNPFISLGMIPDRLEKARIKADKVYLPKSVKSIGLSSFYGAKEIEVYDTVDPDAKPVEDHPLLGGFNGRLGGAGIYQRERYVEAAFNSYWYDHVIIVRSSIDDSIKYRVRMPDGQKRKVYCAFASGWGRNASFNFKAIDDVFDELTPDAKIDYAMNRLSYQEGISEEFRDQLIDFANKRAKAVITKILERDSVSELSRYSQYGIIKKRALNDYIKLAHEMGALRSEQWLAEWKA